MTADARIAERVQTAELRNGARLLMLENHANVTVDVVGLLEGGMYLEDPERAGVADVMVSLLDRGTRRRDHAAIATALESNGAVLSYGLTQEGIVVRGRCLTEDLELLFELLGETLREPVFPDDQMKLVKEDNLIGLREAAYDTHERARRSAATRLLGAGHPYARQPLGEERVVESLRRDEIVRQHEHMVCGGALLLAVLGDIEPGMVQRLSNEHLGGLPAGLPGVSGEAPKFAAPQAHGDPLPHPAAPPTIGGSPTREHIEIPDKEQVDIVVIRPGVPRSAPDFEHYGIANFIFGGSFVSRLNQSLRDRDGLTYGAHSVIVSGREPGFWIAMAGVDPANVTRAIDGMLAEMSRMADEGPTEQELAMARDHLTGSFPIRLETNRQVAAALIDGVRHGRGLDYIDRYRDRIRAITRDDAAAAAKRLFAQQPLAIATAGTMARRAGSQSR